MSPTRKAEAGDTSGLHILKYPHGWFASREKESAFSPSPALIARRRASVPWRGRIAAGPAEHWAHTRAHTHASLGVNEPGSGRLTNETDLPEPWRRSQGPKSHRFPQICCRLSSSRTASCCGGEVRGVPWRSAIAVVLDTRGSFLSGADREKDGRAVFSKEGACNICLNSQGCLERQIFVVVAEISVSSGVLPDW